MYGCSGWRNSSAVLLLLGDLARVHHDHAVGVLEDHAEIMGNQQDAHPRVTLRDRRVGRGSAPGWSRPAPWWVRRRSATWAPPPGRSRSSRADACPPTTRADRRPRVSRAAGIPTRPSRSMARARASARDTRRWARTASMILIAHAKDRIESRHRLLEDHADALPRTARRLRSSALASS